MKKPLKSRTNLEHHYDHLYKNAVRNIELDSYEIDPWLDSSFDDRFGLSLIIKPSDSVKKKIQEFLRTLKGLEPHQYCYPDTDIHITVISIISCYPGFKLSDIVVSDYIDIIENCLTDFKPLTINFKGLTASPSCLMVQGFIADDGLELLRNRLRNAFNTSGLQQSMDERYLIQTAHATVFRFRQHLNNNKNFLKLIDNYRNYDFGSFEVNTMRLTYNDWYHKQARVEKLHEFDVLENIEISMS